VSRKKQIRNRRRKRIRNRRQNQRRKSENKVVEKQRLSFRKTVEADIGGILSIIGQAQDYLKQQGIDQWQNGYPNRETIADDIKKGYGYVLLMNDIVVGTVAVTFDGEKTYDRIYEGKWLSEREHLTSHQMDYATIHRIAVDAQYKGAGLASEIIRSIEKMCRSRAVHSIRVDTHRRNASMQRLLEKNGFLYCGIIYLEDRSERIAFEKILSDD
jgi:ribosomal protein S18 acetylase RimI-like enzyme